MKDKLWALLIIGLVILGFAGRSMLKKSNAGPSFSVGQPVDSLNGVKVYYNGAIANVSGRNVTADNYNVGLKYQCVEFVKRYYYEHLNHRMPNSYGHAKDFFDSALKDGEYNKQRNLIQYTNPSESQPKVDDLIIFSGTTYNEYGHVAIVSKTSPTEIEIIQQNPGPFSKSRQTFSVGRQQEKWKINNDRIVGWLRKE